MPARELFILTTRLMGLWMLVRSVGSLVGGISYIVSILRLYSSSSEPAIRSALPTMISVQLIPAALEIAIGLVLLYKAASIASRFYPETSEPPVRIELAVKPEGLYRVGSQMLGLYAFVISLRPLASGVANWIDLDPSGSSRDYTNPIMAGVYLACAAFLVFGAKGVAQALSGMRTAGVHTE